MFWQLLYVWKRRTRKYKKSVANRDRCSLLHIVYHWQSIPCSKHINIEMKAFDIQTESKQNMANITV